MRVLFFQPYLAMWRVQFLERLISESEHEILVYDGGFRPKSDSKSVANNRVPFPFQKLFSWSPIIIIKGQEYPFYFSPNLFFRLCIDRPDVIVTEGEINFLNNISVLLYCKLFSKRYVWWSLGKVRTRKPNIVNRILDPVVDFLLLRSSCVMTRTSWAKKYYIEHKAISPERVIVAPNSMDEGKARKEVDQELVDRLKSSSQGRVILYVGALTSQKRPEDAVEAFHILIRDDRYRNCQLWFVGDGPERQNLSSLTVHLGISDNVKFFGKVFDGVGSYFAAADVVVVPGLGGLVINHAMIFGKPVVSRLADGTELDLVQTGETGVLLDDFDNGTFAHAISEVLKPENLVRMGLNARAKVDTFWNIETMIRRVHECVELNK